MNTETHPAGLVEDRPGAGGDDPVGGSAASAAARRKSRRRRTGFFVELQAGAVRLGPNPRSMKPAWKYYLVENSCIVRADLTEMIAERLHRNGDWVNFPDLTEITYNGRQLASEPVALAEARELFAMYPELP